MDKYFFIGGAKGTGKTTLLRSLETTIPIVNTGDIKVQSKNKKDFIQRFYEKVTIPRPLILDTHYAVYNKNNFKRNSLYDELIKLREIKPIELILIETNPEAVLERRVSDGSIKRIYDLKHITREVNYNRKYFEDFCNVCGVEGNILINDDFELCLMNVRRVLQNGN